MSWTCELDMLSAVPNHTVLAPACSVTLYVCEVLDLSLQPYKVAPCMMHA